MRNRALIFIAFAVSLLSFRLAGAQTGVNLLPNPGFEVVKDNWADGWWRMNEFVSYTMDPTGVKIELDSQVKHSGKYSCHISFPGTPEKAARGAIVGQQLQPMFQGGETYTYSCWVKTQGLDGSASLELLEYPPPFPAGSLHESKRISGTTDWTRLSITFKARKDIDQVQIRVSAHSPDLKGEVWFDDGKLEKGPTVTPYTDEWEKEFYVMKETTEVVPFDFQVTTDYATPHTAPSVADGAEKIPVAFAMYWSRLREVSELIERANITAYTAAMDASGGGKLHVKCAERLRDVLNKDPKVLVLSPDTWELLVSEDRNAIEKRVRQGMGLVFYDCGGNPLPHAKELLDKAKLLPGYPVKPAPFIHTYQLEQGPVVIFYRREDTENSFMREWRYDRAIRAIYTAARVTMTRLDLTMTPAVPAPGQPWKLHAKMANAADVSDLRVRLRRTAYGTPPQMPLLPVAVLEEKTVPFAGTTDVDLAALAAGEYFIEATALDAAKKPLGWTLLPVAVDGPIRFWDALSGEAVIRPEKDLNVKIRFENTTGVERRATLRAAVWDTEERELVRLPPAAVTLKAGRTEQILPVRAAYSATPMVLLRLELECDGTVLDRRELALSAEPILREPDFRFACYGDFMPGCHELGADVAMLGYGGPEIGMRTYPPFPGFMPHGENAGYFKAEDNVANPQTLAKAGGLLADNLRGDLPFHTVGVGLDDEWTHSFKETPDYLAHFKDWLRKSYGDIAALNKSWGASLRSFDEVNFSFCAPNAIRDRNASPVPWADLQSALERTVADYVAGLQKAAAAVDPDVRLGLSGTQETTATNGLDWWLLMKVFRSLESYGGVHTYYEEAFAQPGTRIFQWSYPAGENVARSRFDPWRDLFRQRDGYMHYCDSGCYALFLPDWRGLLAGKTIAEEVEAIRRGPARLIRGSQRELYGIAILFSMPSYHASYIPVMRQTGKGDLMNDILYSTLSAICDARLDLRFVSYEQLAQGQVTPKLYKVLFLPYAQALSPAEVKGVHAFVEGGGTVIADVRPGVYDAHCFKLPSGQLDDLFGIGPVGEGPNLTAGAFKAGAELGALPQSEVRAGELDLKVLKGTPHGTITAKVPATAATKDRPAQPETVRTAPAVLINPIGKGKVILLNFAFPDYLRYMAGGIGGEVGIETKNKNAAAVRDLLGQLMEKEAGITPVARLLAADGTEMRNVRLYAYRDGAATYIGIMPDYSDDQVMKTVPGKLVVAGKGELYDARQGKYVGNTGAADVQVQEGVAGLYALLPYRVEGIELTARDAQVGQPGSATAPLSVSFKATLKTTGAPGLPAGAGRHVLVARLVRPDGSERRTERMTFEMNKGTVEAAIPLALNDPPGDWKLLVQDAATGVHAEVVVHVKARE